MKISILEKVVAGALLIRRHATDNSLTRTLYRCRLRFHAVFPASLLTKGAGIFDRRQLILPAAPEAALGERVT